MRHCGFVASGVTALFLTLGVSSSAWADGPARFDDHKVVRVRIDSEDQLEQMRAISSDVWSHRVDLGEVDFRIPPDRMDDLEATGFEYDVLIDDVQALIDSQQEPREGGFFSSYRTYTEVSDYIDQLVALNPAIASRFDVGTSIEGRTIFGIRIGAGPDANPGFLMHGCQHAREWISVMVPMYIADALVRGYGSDSEITRLVDEVEFFIVPIVNPDGFEYTWTDNRLWRKNRRSWYGVDLNRNWGYEWGGEGSSGQVFSETYRGESPFSEPETAAMRDFLLAHPQIQGHIDFHSYAQLVLQPWGYSPQLPPDHAYLDYLGGEIVASILGVHGTRFDHGPAYTILYPASGVAPDYSYGELGINGFTIELRDTGRYGFLLPADQIIPSGEEMLPAMLNMADEFAVRRMDLTVDALVGGEVGAMRVDGAQPNSSVYFVYSLRGEGERFVKPLGVTLGLAAPVLAGQDQADGSGVAEFSTMVPPRASGLNVWLQAAGVRQLSDVESTQVE